MKILLGALFGILLALAPSEAWAQINGDYRSAATGNWNDTNSWEKFNGVSWVATNAFPTSDDRAITIRSAHTVTVTANVTVDEVTVALGGQVTVNSSFGWTIANGVGTDLTINGTVLNSGTLNCAADLTVAGTMTGSGNINFSKAGNQTFTITTGAVLGPLLNFTINSGSTTTLSSPVFGAVTGGSAALTVASGGTLMGAGAFIRPFVLSGTIAPGNSVAELDSEQEVWNPGGAYVWEINNATGEAGTDWDFLLLNGGGIDIQATSGNPFTIKVASLNGSAPGNMANFNKDTTNTWTIASADPFTDPPSTVTGFAANKFIVDYSSVSNDLAGGVFSVVHEEDDSPEPLGDSVRVRFSANHAPLALAANYTRLQGASLKIDIADLIANRTSDVDGQARSLRFLQSSAGSMKSANGYTVTTNATYISYTNSMNNAVDTIDYVVLDEANYRAGDTLRYATNTITITTTNATGLNTNYVSLSSSGGTNTVKFAGIPHYFYDVERTSDLTPIVTWSVIGDEIEADDAGIISFIDPTPTSPAFYRVKLD